MDADKKAALRYVARTQWWVLLGCIFVGGAWPFATGAQQHLWLAIVGAFTGPAILIPIGYFGQLHMIRLRRAVDAYLKGTETHGQ